MGASGDWIAYVRGTWIAVICTHERRSRCAHAILATFDSVAHRAVVATRIVGQQRLSTTILAVAGLLRAWVAVVARGRYTSYAGAGHALLAAIAYGIVVAARAVANGGMHARPRFWLALVDGAGVVVGAYRWFVPAGACIRIALVSCARVLVFAFNSVVHTRFSARIAHIDCARVAIVAVQGRGCLAHTI